VNRTLLPVNEIRVEPFPPLLSTIFFAPDQPSSGVSTLSELPNVFTGRCYPLVLMARGNTGADSATRIRKMNLGLERISVHAWKRSLFESGVPSLALGSIPCDTDCGANRVPIRLANLFLARSLGQMWAFWPISIKKIQAVGRGNRSPVAVGPAASAAVQLFPLSSRR